MPAKNVVKNFVKGSFYHIYNRGVEKRNIFQDASDYKVFLKYLKEYLSIPPQKSNLKTTISLQGTTFKGVPRQPKNYHNKVELVCFCLMPNHFHLLIKQNEKRIMENFMRSLATRYSMYFNKKYKRVGPLFQGIYKAALVNKENYLLHLSRYIHLNPLEYTNKLEKAYSSYADYIGVRKTPWLNPKPILSFFERTILPDFTKINSYKDFVEKFKKDSKKILGDLTLED